MSDAPAQPLRFLVAPDSFKGTFSATEVAEAIGAGVVAGGGVADMCPVADGGEGTADVLRQALGGSVLRAPAHDPVGRPLEAEYVALGDGVTAVIDTAAASGLPLVTPVERDAEAASTYGTGELIVAAIAGGARRVLLGCGGSATTDGGAGAIQAIRRAGGLRGTSLEVLCDVNTPFEDAARVFAPQKGADAEAVRRLDARLTELATELAYDPRGIAMTGCAGGLSGGLWGAFGAKLWPGGAFVLELLGFESRLPGADAVITGEGRIDAQSLDGKVVGRIAELCATAERDLYVLVGQDGLDRGLIGGLPIRSVSEAPTLEALRAGGEAIARAARGPSLGP